MAKAIQLDFSPRDHEAELRQGLADAPVEHAEAILEFIELIEVLHQQKVLSTLRGAIGARDNLVTCLSAAAAQPESIRALRNLLALSKILSRIDPGLLDAVDRTMENLSGGRGEPNAQKAPGWLQIGKLLWSPPARRALFAGGLILAGIGLHLEKQRRSR
ncbi:MAG: DUF1641 domain-containing protein [Acidobacteriota bacterium]